MRDTRVRHFLYSTPEGGRIAYWTECSHLDVHSCLCTRDRALVTCKKCIRDYDALQKKEAPGDDLS